VPLDRNSVRGPKPKGDPDFLPRGATNGRVAFIKESRMEFANANKVYRKSGGSPTIAFVESCRIDHRARSGSSRYAAMTHTHGPPDQE
jgi:hypothetical protein